MGNRFEKFKNIKLESDKEPSIAMPKENDRWTYLFAVEELEMRISARDNKEFVRCTSRVLESDCPQDPAGESRTVMIFSDKFGYAELVARLIKAINGGVVEAAAYENFLADNTSGSNDDPKKGAGALFRMIVEGKAAQGTGNIYRSMIFEAVNEDLYTQYQDVVSTLVS